MEEAQAFLRSSESGFVIGTYCRVVVKRVPASWVDQLGTISKAIVLGGLLPNECGPYDFFQLRLKKHRCARSHAPLVHDLVTMSAFVLGPTVGHLRYSSRKTRCSFLSAGVGSSRCHCIALRTEAMCAFALLNIPLNICTVWLLFTGRFNLQGLVNF